MLYRISRLIDGSAQLRLHHPEIHTVENLPVRHILNAVFNIRDTRISNWVGTQIRWGAIFIESGCFLHVLEESRHPMWIKSRTDQYVEADAISLFFVVAGKVQLRLNLAGLRGHQNRLSRLRIGTCCQDGEGCRRQRRQHAVFLCGDHASKVFLGDVRYFMRHDARQFGFALRRQDKPAVEAHEAARQRECVDRRVAEGKKFELLIGMSLIRAENQPIAEAGKVVRYFGIFHITAVGPDLGHDLEAKLPFLVRRHRCPGYIAEIGQFVGKTIQRKQYWQNSHDMAHFHVDKIALRDRSSITPNGVDSRNRVGIKRGPA